MEIRKFRQTHYLNYYTLLWIVALFIILYLYQNWHIDKKFLGIVEKKSHFVGSQESGKVQTVLVSVGQQVKKDQVLATLDLSDLKANLNQLRGELSKIQSMEHDQRNRFSILVRTRALQLENEASDLMDRLSVIEAKTAELAGLNAQIEKLTHAEQAGLGHSRDIPGLTLRRDALAAYLREQSKELDSQTEKRDKTRQSRKLLEHSNLDSLTQSMFMEQLQYTESLHRLVTETEHRISQRTLTSPCNGYVTEILARSGDVVEAYVPAIKVEELKPRFVDVYVPESSNLEPEVGMEVNIYSARKRDYNTNAVVRFIHPGFAQVSNRLSFRGQLFWARKVRAELPRDHSLIPGEVVSVHINKKKNP